MHNNSDLRKQTFKLPAFSPSISAVHMAARLRRSGSDQDEALALIMEHQEMTQKYIESFIEEMSDFKRVHNGLVEISMETSVKVRAIEASEVISATKKKVYLQFGTWVVGCITAAIAFLASLIANYFMKAP